MLHDLILRHRAATLHELLYQSQPRFLTRHALFEDVLRYPRGGRDILRQHLAVAGSHLLNSQHHVSVDQFFDAVFDIAGNGYL